MGDVDEFSLPVRLFLRAYRWRKVDPVPWTPLARPLSACRLALVSSAGFVAPGQDAFDEGKPGGDVSFREIPSDIDVSTLRDAHRSQSFDHTGMRADPNLVFPVDRVNELVKRGRIGSVASHHLSFMGSITAPGRLVDRTAPDGAKRLVADGANVALLVPV